MIDNSLKQRSTPKKLRVCFPDGTILCYTSAKETFIQTLKKIGPDRLLNVNLEIGSLPIFSKVIYPKYKKWMVPLDENLYVNTQSVTEQKFRQLYSINQQLNLNLQIDMSEDFVGEKVLRGHKNVIVLQVTFDDGEVIGEENTSDTFIQCIWKIGIDKIYKRNIQYGGNPLITTKKQYNTQVQIDTDKWLIVPSRLKDKVKILKVIEIMLNIKLDIFYL